LYGKTDGRQKKTENVNGRKDCGEEVMYKPKNNRHIETETNACYARNE
jgi:hypothetical protein